MLVPVGGRCVVLPPVADVAALEVWGSALSATQPSAPWSPPALTAALAVRPRLRRL